MTNLVRIGSKELDFLFDEVINRNTTQKGSNSTYVSWRQLKSGFPNVRITQGGLMRV
jgi:hypothetical protein